jgi:selenobiotic family peptide radical SAM maturase
MDINLLFPISRSLLADETWQEIKKVWGQNPDPDRFLAALSSPKTSLILPGPLLDLMRLERAIDQAQKQPAEFIKDPEALSLNPTLQVLSLSWKNFPCLIKAKNSQVFSSMAPGSEWVLIWQEPATQRLQVEAASEEELLVLKMLAEDLEVEEVAEMGGLSKALVEEAVHRAARKGLLILPRSKIRRDPLIFPSGEVADRQFFSSTSFTLQWHITQDCDLHCRHCYDRSPRASMDLSRSMEVLEDLKTFCRNKKVKGHISFTGGNPFLYPHFFKIYQAAVEKGFSTAILGNPVPREKLEELSAIEKPDFFQVSLEGLPEYNDYIRGIGHFDRTIAFLSLLKEQGIYSMVMLTLTRDNLPQVLPLAERLRQKTEALFFNRLSMVGEGAKLLLPTREEFQEFLKAYLDARRSNSILGLKDNLFNILFYQNKGDFFGGCAGYGCSAAFNFMTLLPDGDVHACRKFPSPIGKFPDQSFTKIYDSEKSHAYRAGSKACASCPIRPVCGGCLAVASSLGRNIFEERDPFCFMNNNNFS